MLYAFACRAMYSWCSDRLKDDDLLLSARSLMSDRLRDRGGGGRSIDEAQDSSTGVIDEAHEPSTGLSSKGTSDWLSGANEDAQDSSMGLGFITGVSSTGKLNRLSGTEKASSPSSAFHCCTRGSSDKPVLKARLTLLFSANQSSFGDSIKTSRVGDLGAISRSKWEFGLKIVGSFVEAVDELSTYTCALGDIVVVGDFSVGMFKNESTLSFIGGLGRRVVGVWISGSEASSGMDLANEAFVEGTSSLDWSSFISSPSSAEMLVKECRTKNKGAVT